MRAKKSPKKAQLLEVEQLGGGGRGHGTMRGRWRLQEVGEGKAVDKDV